MDADRTNNINIIIRRNQPKKKTITAGSRELPQGRYSVNTEDKYDRTEKKKKKQFERYWL